MDDAKDDAMDYAMVDVRHHGRCHTGESYPPPCGVVQSAIISVVQSLILRIVVQWANLVGYYDLWYNKGLHNW